jgi:tetratricopeptide (TPR) repeat protein
MCDMRSIWVISLWLVVSVVQAQQPLVDSLTRLLEASEGEQKVKLLNELFRATQNQDPVNAAAYARQAANLAEQVNDTRGLAAACNNLGVAYRTQGALDKALEYYLKALDGYRAIENPEGLAATQNNIGTIYSLKKDFSRAVDYFGQSYEIFKTLNDTTRMVGALNNMGNLHNDLRLYDQAEKYYDESFALSLKQGKPLADAVNNMGNLYFRQERYQRAAEFYKKALDLARKDNNRLLALSSLASLGEVFTKAKQPRPAQLYLDSALTLCRDLQALMMEPAILRSMATNYANQNKMKEAYEVMQQYDASREKVFGEESTTRIAQMEMALSIRDREEEFEALEKDDQIKTLQLRNTRLGIAIAALVVLGGAAGLNLFLSKRKTANL